MGICGKVPDEAEDTEPLKSDETSLPVEEVPHPTPVDLAFSRPVGASPTTVGQAFPTLSVGINPALP